MQELKSCLFQWYYVICIIYLSISPRLPTGPVAQRITRLTTDQKIPGSNPGRVAKFSFCIEFKFLFVAIFLYSILVILLHFFFYLHKNWRFFDSFMEPIFVPGLAACVSFLFGNASMMQEKFLVLLKYSFFNNQQFPHVERNLKLYKRLHIKLCKTNIAWACFV